MPNIDKAKKIKTKKKKPQKANLPATVKKTKTNALSYYGCLLTKAQQG